MMQSNVRGIKENGICINPGGKSGSVDISAMADRVDSHRLRLVINLIKYAVTSQRQSVVHFAQPVSWKRKDEDSCLGN